MQISLKKLAELVGGTLQGDGEIVIQAARALSDAQQGDITFVENDKNLSQLHLSKASAALVHPSIPVNGKPLIQVKDPLFAFISIVQYFSGDTKPKILGVDPKAHVDPSVKVGADVSIYPFAYVAEGSIIGDRCQIFPGVFVGRNCRIGHDVVLHPNAVLYDDSVVGDRCIVHANAVIGADGYGYRFQNGKHVKVPQLGNVELGCDVEIGACSTIDRATFETTRIGEGTKIDNLVQVAHNCQIGKHNLFVSQMGIAGSSSTGNYVIIAGQVGIADHVHLGDGVVVGAKAGVSRDVLAGQRVLGAPATPELLQKKILMSLEKLPEIRKDVRKIKQFLHMEDEEEKSGE